MATVVIGGHSRSVGKTSVVAGIISAFPDLRWTAIKITQYGHGICSANGEACDCVTADHSLAVSEEQDRSGDSDSSRYLLAGADHSWWVRTQQGQLAEAMPRVRKILAGAQNVIIESNSVMRFLKPDMYLTVLDPGTADFKASAQMFLDRADAVLLHSSRENRDWRDQQPSWTKVSLKPALDRPIFEISPPNYVTPDVVNFVRERLILVPK